jgi:hypothetical protein
MRDQQITQLGWGWCREHFFSGAVDLSNLIDDYMKCCHTWTVRGMHM